MDLFWYKDGDEGGGFTIYEKVLYLIQGEFALKLLSKKKKYLLPMILFDNSE